MRFLLKNGKKKELIILSVIYFCTHWMLLILSGRWWDDWCMYNQPTAVMKEWALSAGRPSIFFYMEFAKAIPEAGYRIITFIMFYYCTLFLYKILKNWLLLSDRACFLICAIYIVIPSYDCRALLAVFPYSIGLFFFMAGMSTLSVILREKQMTWSYRILLWLLFGIGFTLNSNLCFYAIVLLMILMMTRSIKGCIKYLDFFISPIVFFGVKGQCFPTYGAYEDYNSITIKNLFTAIKYIVPADLYMLKELCRNFFLCFTGTNMVWEICTGLMVVFVIRNRKKIFSVLGQIFESYYNSEKQEVIICKKIKSEDVWICIIGLVALSAGLFSYVAVRLSYKIPASLLGGRDAVLVSFGAAMLIYGMLSLVFDFKMRIYIFVLLILCGLIYFNAYYLSYQQDYYRQLGFQYQLKEHMELGKLSNIVYLNSDVSLVNIHTLYALNGSAEIVYDNQERLIMGGFGETSFLEDDYWLDYFVESGNYHMSQYDRSHKRIDAVVQYSFDVNLKETLKMKVYEIMDDSRFEDWIQNRSNLVVYLDGTEEYNQLLSDYGYENIEE